MASSSHDHHKKHEVFISFSGQDTRRGFLSHLEKELGREKIDFYVDKRLNRGDEISSSLLKAIEESQISLILFSKNYASSKWCLDELVKIIECMEGNKQIVLPVFYDIDPSVVRHQKGIYGDAFADHESNFEKNLVRKWRSALKKAADLAGYVLANYENESVLIDGIVGDILKSLHPTQPSKSKAIVGIDQHLAYIKSFLEMEAREVQILGIWGKSGIGKTTIAQFVLEKFSSHYEGCYFLNNVREGSQNEGLSSLLEQLISKLEGVKYTFFPNKLSRRKVLVVLDDVSTLEQLRYLVTERICWGPGSKVIVTSKDKKVLTSGGVHAILELNELNIEESLKLFSLNAFKKSHPEKGYEELSKRVVDYAKGLPLALEVLGLYLHSESIEIWEDVLRKLGQFPNSQIQDALRVSYNGLDDAEKELFLDVAFFYKGEDKNHVMRLLDANGLPAASGIKRLEEKALITISNDNIIQMHDLIQEMGWGLVRHECKDKPGKRSRLRDIDEVYDVLKNNKGTDAIKGIVFYASLINDLELNRDTFKKMTNLRILKFYAPWHVRYCDVHHPASFESFSGELKRLEWNGYPFKSLPLSFYPEMLVELSIPNSHVRKLWNEVKDSVSSKRINLGSSMELLDLSNAQNDEWEDICSCGIDPHLLSLCMIVASNQGHSKYLKTTYSVSNFRSPGNSDVSFCFSVKEFSLSSKEITDLDLVASKNQTLYSSVGSLCELRRNMPGSSRLDFLPINELCCLRSFEALNLSDGRHINQSPKLHILFDALPSLRELFLAGCSSFFKVPDIGNCPSLKYLGLKGSNIDSLPANIKNLPLLKTIYLRNCRRLLSIPELPSSVMHLDATDCTSLESVFPLTTSTLQQEDIASYFFSFVNCLKLDKHSLCSIMDNAYHSSTRAVHHNLEASVFCHPSHSVPEWFRWKRKTEASITMQLSQAVDELLGFVFCSVLPRLSSNETCLSYLKCLCYFEDGEKLEGPSRCDYAITELFSDHVFLWYDPHYCKLILEGVKTRGKVEDNAYSSKVLFEFYVATYDDDNGGWAKHEGLIQECGIHPIYASEQQVELAPDLKMKSKKGLEIDEQEQLHPPKKSILQWLFNLFR